MARTVSDFLVQRLAAWGVDCVFGYPGDGINGVLGALQRHEAQDRRVRFVQARHEEMAALMACGYAKFSGRVGVCLATSGPGAIHLLNGLYDAKMDHAPVVAIVGQAARTAIGGDYQQEVDLASLFKDVAHEYVHTIMSPEAARHVIDRAIRIAYAERTVTCVIVPKDIQEAAAVPVPPHEHDTVHTSVGYAPAHVTPSETELKRAADVLNAGERIAMLVGAGAAQAAEEVMAVAERLRAGVAKALLGRAVLADDLPYVTGAIGLLGTRPSYDMMRDCDTLLVVGSSFPYGEFLPKEGHARGVQVDIDGRFVGLRYPMEVHLVGDARDTLRALLPLLRPTQQSAHEGARHEWRARIEGSVAEWWELMNERALEPANPINPQRVFSELSPRLPNGCILTADSGSAANWFARNLKLRPSMMASLSGSLATMGCAVPYAIAAKFAHPDRPVIALVGDGAMQMNGNAELLTAFRHRKEWSDPRFIVAVLNNGDLNEVTWEMRAMAGDPRFAASQDLPPFPYAAYASMIGMRGIRVDRPEDVGDAWETALAAKGPVLLEMMTDPDVPPLPPHITLKQAKAFGASLLEGDSEKGGVLRRTWRQLFAG
ncbi:thiamine pyrophosphate-requiring protein [Pendulispora rubella]|uniref:Thiamine pyrophosphate-requiring protein n=1 Tax=Pendulispora rubella TaxID=2741070 RepID=A0ABZ2LFB8_9BACT